MINSCLQYLTPQIDDFFLEKVFPVVVSVNGKVVLLTPLYDGQATGFLIGEPGSPFLKMSLMKFLFCIHGIILLKVTRIAQFERIERKTC